jgi:hypothetical protein
LRPSRSLSARASLVRSFAIGAGFALAWIAANPDIASADAIPGPPLDAAAPDRAGAFCPPREGSGWNGAGLATAIATIAIAARRRGDRA